MAWISGSLSSGQLPALPSWWFSVCTQKERKNIKDTEEGNKLCLDAALDAYVGGVSGLWEAEAVKVALGVLEEENQTYSQLMETDAVREGFRVSIKKGHQFHHPLDLLISCHCTTFHGAQGPKRRPERRLSPSLYHRPWCARTQRWQAVVL